MKKVNNNETNKVNKNEENDNDLSDFTNKAVFKGALNIIEQENKENTQYSIKKNQNIMNTPHNLLQNLIKQENTNNNISFQANNSISSSGFVSFRNKKARFVNLNNTNNTENNKIEEEIDPKLITQSILIKLATSGKPHISNSSFSKEGHLIESTKENEVEIEEKDLKVIHTNSSINSNASHESNDKNYEEEENDKNVFWNLNSHKDKIVNEKFLNNFNINDDSFRKKKKEKYLNSIICTLSMLEKGKAIFFFFYDMIFVLPSFFVPKNLKIGNTYKFKVKEYLQYSKKNDEIQEIQKKYAK